MRVDICFRGASFLRIIIFATYNIVKVEITLIVIHIYNLVGEKNSFFPPDRSD